MGGVILRRPSSGATKEVGPRMAEQLLATGKWELADAESEVPAPGGPEDDAVDTASEPPPEPPPEDDPPEDDEPGGGDTDPSGKEN